MTHELKCWDPFFTDVVEGRKTFELRTFDRPYKINDSLLLRHYDPVREAYSGRECVVDVLGIYNDLKQFGLSPDMCIMSIAKVVAEYRPGLEEFEEVDDPNDDEGYF